MRYLLLCLLLVGCSKQLSYKEILATAEHKVGDVITVNHGFYKGCHLLVKFMRAAPDGWVIYEGVSEDCPNITGVSIDDTYSWRVY